MLGPDKDLSRIELHEMQDAANNPQPFESDEAREQHPGCGGTDDEEW